MKKIAVIALSFVSLTAAYLHAQEDRHIRVINHASSAIRYLYATNVDRDRWGYDLLGPLNIISPGYYEDFNMDDGTGHCLYDMKAVLFDGRTATSHNFNACTNSTWTVTDGR